MPNLFVGLGFAILMATPALSSIENLASKAAILEKQAAELESRLAPLTTVNFRSSLHRSFHHQLRSALTVAPLRLEEVLEASDLSRTPRGNWAVMTPEDLSRPGIIATFDATTVSHVDSVIAEMRNATTAVIISRNPLSRKKLTQLRANSFLVAKAGPEFSQALRETNAKLELALHQLSFQALTKTLNRWGRGPLRSASERLQRAIEGGLGHRQWMETRGQILLAVKTASQKLREDLKKILALRMEARAVREASRIQARAEEAKKPLDLVGFEIAVSEDSAIGIEYIVPTFEGPTFHIQNVGHCFEDCNEAAVPSKAYAKFNVSLIQLYETNRILREADVRDLIEKYSFSVRAGNELQYQGE